MSYPLIVYTSVCTEIWFLPVLTVEKIVLTQVSINTKGKLSKVNKSFSVIK